MAVKEMKINKKLLTELPEPQKVDEPVGPQQQLIDRINRLEAQLQTLQQHQAIIAEFEASLMKAFQDEIDLLDECQKLTKNDMQKRSFASLSSCLNRIKSRWSERATFHIDRKKMSIEVRK